MTTIRKIALENQYGGEKDFRWRGGEISRVEGFTDAVFAFAVTLLVVSLEVPHTFNDLLVTMRGFLAFAICFAMLVYLWHLHYVYFRRYGLEDTVTITLNAILLFVILFYIYPLKFLFTLIINFFLGFDVSVHLPDGTVLAPLEEGQGVTMMYVYNGGYIAVMALYALLYWRAYRKRDELQLNDIEAFDTRASIQRLFVQ
ncbi:MAG TPA: TMEM175 family protein, partial [Bacteroidota bacterium]